MANTFAKKVDCASEYIMALQSVMRKVTSVKGLDPGLLHQFLDDESLYIKQMPKDGLNVFRGFADVTRFTQSEASKVLDSYIDELKKNLSSHELSSLLYMMTNTDTSQYIKNLRKYKKGKPEVDLVLIAMLFEVELTVFYATEEGLKNQMFSFPYTKPRSKAKLYFGHEGYFDVVYSKSFIKSAGICQSLVLDVIDSVLEDKGKTKVKPHAPVYQNIGYQLWKQQQSMEEGIAKLSLFSSHEPLKLPGFGASEEDPTLEKIRAGSPMDPKTKPSDSTLGSNSLKRQIRSYMSSTSVLGFQNKLSPPRPHEPHREKSSTNISAPPFTPLRKVSQPAEDFASSLGHYKPFIPKSRLQGHSGATSSYYHPPTSSLSTTSLPTSASTTEQGNMMTAYVYPQAYTPIYIPIIVQSGAPSSSYYAPSTSSELLTGRIKFFDETQNYGFFTLDATGSDLFVHYDDLLKSGITKDYIQMAKAMNVRFAFRCVSYYGKYNLSYKAVDIQVLHDKPTAPTSKPASTTNLPK